MPMLTLNIDGQEVKVEKGTSVIQAAEKLGIYIPRYCYHPGLSLAGSCRMCLVEIEGPPVLQIACYTMAQDGMKVTTNSERVIKARQSMLEFLLSNHPLDCPVCDQSGECDLQNFYMEHGQYDSRFAEDKLKNKKAFPIGPHVLLDQERCIQCTRCVRFTEEVSKSNELGMFNRGNHSVIDLYPGTVLDNPYSGNVIDICPVGALTEKEFRFQCRVWYLETEESICNGCSRGCNINVHFNTKRPFKAGGRRIMRIKPRFNPEVNQWWICDRGRFGYRFADDERIEYPALKKDNILIDTEWDQALSQAASLLKNTDPDQIGVIVSPQMSNEELVICKALFVDHMKIENIAFNNPWEEPGQEDEILMKSDLNPNTKGAIEIGFKTSTDKVLEKVSKGLIRVLYIFRHDFFADQAVKLLSSAESIIYQGVNWNPTAESAQVVLPGATHFEKDGTFTNFEGRIQKFKQAFLPLEDSRNDCQILLDLAEKLGIELKVSEESLFESWRGYSPEEIDEFGTLLTEEPVTQT
jgi:NADH-quinone oxidoreductase subunit G